MATYSKVKALDPRDHICVYCGKEPQAVAFMLYCKTCSEYDGILFKEVAVTYLNEECAVN